MPLNLHRYLHCQHASSDVCLIEPLGLCFMHNWLLLLNLKGVESVNILYLGQHLTSVCS